MMTARVLGSLVAIFLLLESVTGQTSDGCIAGFRCDLVSNSTYHRVECMDGVEVKTPYTDSLCTELDDAGEVVTTSTECSLCGSYFTATTERFFNGDCSGDPLETSLLAGELGVCLDNEGDDLKVIFTCTNTTAVRNLYATDDCSGDAVGSLGASSESCSAIMGEMNGQSFTASTILYDVVCVDGETGDTPDDSGGRKIVAAFPFLVSLAGMIYVMISDLH